MSCLAQHPSLPSDKRGNLIDSQDFYKHSQPPSEIGVVIPSLR